MEMDKLPMIRSCSSITAEKKKKRSSPSSQKEEEKSLCFFAYTGYHLQCNRKDPVVYHLNFNGKKRNFCRRCCVELKDGGVVEEEEGQKKKKMRIGAGCVNEITPLKTRWVPNGGDMVVSLGSTVYVLGGLTHKQKKDDNFSDKVLYFDTSSCSNPVWKRGPNMLNPRNSSNGDAIVLEGKIYVFGGTGTDPWAEVFDPKNQSWEPLPIPLPLPSPEYGKGKTRVIYAYGSPLEEKKIVVNAYSCDPDIYTPYEYHVKSGNWKKGAFTFKHKPTVVGNLYYYLSNGKLVASSLNTDRCYYGKIRGYEAANASEYVWYEYAEPEPTIVHLGGKYFCLLTFLPVVGNRTKIRCTKFKVSKRVCDHSDRNEGTLKASVVAHVSDIVDRSLWNEHILVLDGMPAQIQKVELCVSKVGEDLSVSVQSS